MPKPTGRAPNPAKPDMSGIAAEHEAAAYILSVTKPLRDVALKGRLTLLAYLLQLACEEASAHIRPTKEATAKRRPPVGPKPKAHR